MHFIRGSITAQIRGSKPYLRLLRSEFPRPRDTTPDAFNCYRREITQLIEMESSFTYRRAKSGRRAISPSPPRAAPVTRGHFPASNDKEAAERFAGVPCPGREPRLIFQRSWLGPRA